MVFAWSGQLSQIRVTCLIICNVGQESFADKIFKGNVAIYKDLYLEIVTKNSFCHEFAARKCN